MMLVALIGCAIAVGCIAAPLLGARHYGAGVAACVTMLLLGFLCTAGGLFLPPVALAVLTMLLVCCVLLNRRPNRKQVVLLSWIAVAVGMLGGVGLSLWYVKYIYELRATYPFVSVTSRLAYESAENVGDSETTPRDLNARFGPPPKEAVAWASLDAAESQKSWSPRGHALEEIHSSIVEHFINAPGFGVSRMSSVSRWALDNHRQPPQRLSAAREQYPASDRPGPLRSVSPPSAASGRRIDLVESDLWTSYEDGLRDFFATEDLGLAIDRDHVAGFVPHRFSIDFPNHSGPERPRWQLRRLELVSLRRFGRPMVYVTNEKLPQMSELQNTPTRELNAFEAAALDSIAKGEELCYEQQGRTVFALGALRAREQCTKCHEVQRGALLGAFSYEFLGVKEPAKPAI